MDKLVAKVIRILDVPEDTPPPRFQGRIGELWHRLGELAAGMALEVECRDASHLSSTKRDIEKRAEGAGIQIGFSRKDRMLYCWKIAETKE